MKCPNCGKEVDTNLYNACPYCRTSLSTVDYSYNAISMQDSFGNSMAVGKTPTIPRKKVKLKIILPIIIGIFVLLIIVGSIGKLNTNAESTQVTNNNNQIEYKNEIEYIEISAAQYFNDYQSNAVLADGKYKNKYLAITGKITEIGTDDILNRAYIKFEISYLKEVMCYFSSITKWQLADVSMGQTVVIYGKGDGETLHGYTVSVTGCSLTK